MSINWKGNRPAAIDFETTGLEAGRHEIIQVAVVVLNDDLTVDESVAPFVENIRPEHPERSDPAAMATNGLDLEDLQQYEPADVVAEWLLRWFEGLRLLEGRKLVPVAHNWAFESAFLDQWLGAPLKERVFHYHARDTAAVVGYLRDRNLAGLQENNVGLSLSKICPYFGVSNDRPHDAYHDALACGELYRRLVTN